MSHYSVRPQLLQNAWVYTFCGAKHPTEKERDLHMAGNCKDSPIPLTEELKQSRQRPPMVKAKKFSHSKWSLDQPFSLRGYVPPHVQQEIGYSGDGVNRGRSLSEETQEVTRSVRPPRPFHWTVPAQLSSLTGFGDGAASQQKNRRVSDSQELPTYFSHNAPPNEQDMSPLAEVNSPVTSSGDKAKVTIIWKKENQTSEREVTYIDNIPDPVTLAWSDTKELFQGNATFSQGNHTGSIFFPTSGEMEAVQPFEVKKKGVAMSMVTLKLAEVKSPIKSEPSKLPMPSPIPKLNPKNESEEAKSVPPTEKEKKGMREQLLKQNQDLKDKEERIRRMKEEIHCLNKTIDTVKDDKQKLKTEIVKLDEQLIQVMTELSSIRAYGTSEGQKLEKESKSLKDELELLRHKEPIGGDELLAAKEQIDQLKSHINSMKNTKLQDHRLNENIQTLQVELKAFQGKEEELQKIKKEQQELVNTNKDLHAELNASIKDRKELEKKTSELKAEVMEKVERIQKELENYEKEKNSLRQEQGELIKNLKASLEESKKKVNDKEKEIINLVKSKMSIESDLKQARNELKENSGNKEATEQVEQLKKDNSELKEEINKLRENNKKYKNEELEQHEELRGELKILGKKLEGKKNDFEEISMELAKYKDSMQDSYSKIEEEKRDLQEQVDGLHTLVNGLKVSTSDLKFKLEYSDKEREKMITENAKLGMELESERESLAILKQLIGKLNKENQTGDEIVIKLKEELEQMIKYKNSLEYKLEQMSQGIADKNSELLDPTKNVNKQVLGPIYNNVELGKLTTLYSKYQLESEKQPSD